MDNLPLNTLPKVKRAILDWEGVQNYEKN